MNGDERQSNKLDVIANDITYIKRDVQNLVSSIHDVNDKMSIDYITKQEFEPVKRLVFGLVSLILIAVVVALLALIIRK